MAKTARKLWATILTYSVVVLIIGLLVWLITWQPTPDNGIQHIVVADNRTVEDSLDATGVVVTQVIDNDQQKVIQFYVDEYSVNGLSVDQDVDITITALDNTDSAGKIYSISDQPRLTGDTTEYEVVVQFDDEPDTLRNGMHSDVNIVLTAVDNVLAVPNSSVYKVKNDYFVNRVTEERRVDLPRLGIEQSTVDSESIKVDIGLEGDEYTEITSGLQVGDQVILP